MPVPESPKIYHITHLDNLSKIVDGVLWSDADRIRRGLECRVVGMNEIKRRRLEELIVDCYPDTRVGDYVPFYFCPRSIMLYLLYMGNHPDLTYHGGQQPIIHLQADLDAALQWAEDQGRRWAFCKGNAGTRYMQFVHDPAQLNNLEWGAIAATDWRDPDVREGKQAEFLTEESFPWELIECIGVINAAVAQQVTTLIHEASYQPTVAVMRSWYY